MPRNFCRWGILSTAVIARKTWKAIQLADNARLVAVASRDLDRCREFIDMCQNREPVKYGVEAVGDYAALIERTDVDAVYIPLPTGVRKEWVIRAAEAGKHVLCEKPCAVNAGDLREMIAACERNGVQFMDGVMYMHTARLQQIRAALDGGEIGQLKRIATQFSFCAPPEFLEGNIRTTSDLEPHGCLGDLGWYTIRIALWAANWNLPERVHARLLDSLQRPGSPKPVPMEFAAEMSFPEGVSASFYCSFRTHHQQWANFSGTRGYIQVQDFVLPFFGAETAYDIVQSDFILDGCDFNMERRRRRVTVQEYSNSAANAQETNLIRNFSALVCTGNIDPHWPSISLKTQQVLDACYRSALTQQPVEP
jgi:predicted dehydrogenase